MLYYNELKINLLIPLKQNSKLVLEDSNIECLYRHYNYYLLITIELTAKIILICYYYFFNKLKANETILALLDQTKFKELLRIFLYYNYYTRTFTTLADITKEESVFRFLAAGPLRRQRNPNTLEYQFSRQAREASVDCTQGMFIVLSCFCLFVFLTVILKPT